MRTWSEQVAKHAKSIFVLLAIMTLVLGFGIKNLVQDTDVQSLLGLAKHHSLADQLQAIESGPRTETVVVHDSQLFTASKLMQLSQFETQLADFSFIERVTSLFTTPDIQKYLDERQWFSLLSEDSIQNTPIDELKHKVLGNRSLIHQLISPDATSLVLTIKIKAEYLRYFEYDERN